MIKDPLSIIITIAAFGLVLSIWLVGVVFWSLRKKRQVDEVGERLKLVQSVGTNRSGSGSDDATDGRILRLWRDGKEATTIVPGLDGSSGMVRNLERFRVDAGLESSLRGLILAGMALVGFSAVVTYLLTSSAMMGAAAPIAVAILTYIILTQRVARRQTIFERQLVDALELAARSLRVGHPLVGSFQMISEEIGAPVGNLFGNVCQQQELGVSLDEALRTVATQSHSDDLKLFATSVVIQLRSGGNLADMMERVANVIRERNRLARRVRVLTAQTQMSKRILLALPFFVFVLLNLINPDYMRPLYSTVSGELIMGVAGSGLLLGWLTMNWISKLEV
ncbi:MAG TPA: type II secretion system F family protein [Tepidisphaeraceae bacterium]|jgi:tight adherence protein B